MNVGEITCEIISHFRKIYPIIANTAATNNGQLTTDTQIELFHPIEF